MQRPLSTAQEAQSTPRQLQPTPRQPLPSAQPSPQQQEPIPQQLVQEGGASASASLATPNVSLFRLSRQLDDDCARYPRTLVLKENPNPTGGDFPACPGFDEGEYA